MMTLSFIQSGVLDETSDYFSFDQFSSVVIIQVEYDFLTLFEKSLIYCFDLLMNEKRNTEK